MKKIGMMKGIKLCMQYQKATDAQRERLRGERLRELVQSAKANSPYFKELYKDIGDDFTLSQLPVTNKRELMAHFDEWLTDRDLKLTDIEHFMENEDNIGRKLNGKYMIFTTSGSTGEPLVSVCDETTNGVMSAVNTLRTYARKEDFSEFIKRGARTIGIFATGGFYLGNSSVRARLLAMPWKKRQFGVTSALLPIEQIVSQLNAFQPVMLGGYPTILELLIDEQLSGRLNISPTIIMTGGEYLSENLRARLADAFGCYVQTSYSCTEGGTIACECTEHHFHVNDDWIIIEPVDKDNNPVPDGVQSDKLLLTNLSNYTQPIIRYEVTDRIVMHHEQCPCGKRSPWLTLEGRTDDVVSFDTESGKVKIAPLAIYATLKEVHELRRFQLLVYADNRIKMRLESNEGIERQAAFEKACAKLKAFLLSFEIDKLDISLLDEAPAAHPKSGKFKHIINAQVEE